MKLGMCFNKVYSVTMVMSVIYTKIYLTKSKDILR